MQAMLSFDKAPPLAAPLRFFLSGPLFAALAGCVLLLTGSDLFASRWMPSRSKISSPPRGSPAWSACSPWSCPPSKARHAPGQVERIAFLRRLRLVEGAHAEVEWIDVASLEHCVEIYTRAAAELCA